MATRNEQADLIYKLNNEIRKLIIDFSKKHFKLKDDSEFPISYDRLTKEEINEVTTCIECSLRSLAFEVGYNKGMLSMFPRNTIEKIILDEIYFGEEAFKKHLSSKLECEN